MTSKELFILQNKDKVVIGFKRCIDDATLREHYFLTSNIFCDGFNYYTTSDTNSILTTKRKLKAAVRAAIRLTGKKPQLTGTDNSLGFTRLVYSLK